MFMGNILRPSAFVSERKKVFNIGLLNCRSIGNKSAALVECIVSRSMDLFVTVETWYQPHDASIVCTTPSGFSCIDVPRQTANTGKKGSGGIAFYKSSIRATILTINTEIRTFQFVCVKILVKGGMIIITLI